MPTDAIDPKDLEAARCPAIPEFDPVDGEHLVDPFPLLADARREAPVFYMPAYDMWCVTRHVDVLSIYRDPITYSNIGSHDLLVPVPEEMWDRVGPSYVFPLSLGQLNVTDPPQHTRLRKLLQKSFTPRLVRELEPQVNDLANRLIDEFGDGQIELITAYASPIAIATVADMLGIPADETTRFRSWVDSFFRLTAATKIDDKAEELQRWTDLIDLEEFTREFIERRRAKPKDDLTSKLIFSTSEDGSPSLTDEELLANILGFISAASDSTATLITHATYILLTHRSIWYACRADPSQVPRVIEEVMRLMGPVRGLRKTTTREVSLGGVTIPEGATVYVHVGSANRDETVFADPDEFDLSRPNVNEHLGFGIGAHFCIGAPLARLEGRVALERLLARLPGLRLSNPEVELSYSPNMLVPAPRRLDVELN
jgi:cytochrome P450